MNSRFMTNSVDVYGVQPGSSLSSAVSIGRSETLNDLNIWSNIYDSAKEEITFDGKQLIAPLTSVLNVVFFKIDYFRDNGLQVPTTWSEMVTILDYMDNDSSIEAPIVYGGKDLWSISMIASQLETTIVRPNHPNLVKEIVQNDLKLQDEQDMNLMLERLDKLTDYFQSGSTGFEYALAPGQFAARDYPLMIDGSWSLSAIREANPDAEIGQFLLPGNDDASKNVNYPAKVGAGWSISSKSNNKEAAKKFIEFQFRSDIYTKYVNDLLQGSTVKGINIKDPLAKEISTLPTVITIDNMWVPKMRYDTYMKESIGPGFINNTLSVENALKNIDKILNDDQPIWQSEVENWLLRFPE